MDSVGTSDLKPSEFSVSHTANALRCARSVCSFSELLAFDPACDVMFARVIRTAVRIQVLVERGSGELAVDVRRRVRHLDQNLQVKEE